MRKLPKRPRTFGRTKAKPYPQKKREAYSRGWTEREIRFFDELSPGFAEWYRAHYDEHGRAVVRIQRSTSTNNHNG